MPVRSPSELVEYVVAPVGGDEQPFDEVPTYVQHGAPDPV
jgi:hypothetical protein